MNVQIWAPGFTGFGGGITVFSRELALGLQEMGLGVRLIGVVDSAATWQELPLQGFGKYPRFARNLAFASLALASCVRRRPDLTLSTHINLGPIAHLAKRILRIPFMLVAHGLDVHPSLVTASRLKALRAADRILAVSSWTKQRVLELGDIDDSRIDILPDTFEETRFTAGPKSAKFAERYNLQAGEKVILTVARLNPGEGYKGYNRVVQALPAIRAACGAVRFLIVGKGDDRARVESLARELGVVTAVSFAGFVPDDELADYYRLADVFAMPSSGEGFGIVFLEAMACGTPVLAGNCDGSVDALDGGRFGRLVDPTSVEAVAQGIIDLLNKQGDPVWFDRTALSQAVVQRFGRQAFRGKLRKIFFCLKFSP